jgi:hypothetical protein
MEGQEILGIELIDRLLVNRICWLHVSLDVFHTSCSHWIDPRVPLCGQSSIESDRIIFEVVEEELDVVSLRVNGGPWGSGNLGVAESDEPTGEAGAGLGRNDQGSILGE